MYDCEFVCEAVNYYHGLQLLMLLSFIYCFHVLISDLLDDWVLYGSVCFYFNFPYTVFFNIYPFRIGSFSISRELVFVFVFGHSIFDIVFVLKCKKRTW